jgi:tetratricopeptide (TPR) repeat protein
MQLAKEHRWARAEAALRSSLEIRTVVLGPDDEDTLRSRGQRAALLRRLDRTDEAVAELDACVEALGRTLGDTARPTLEMRVLRGQVLRKADRGAAALPDARFVTQALAGRPDVLNFRAIGLLGVILNDLGRHEEAAEAFVSQAPVFDGLPGPLRLAAHQLRANHAGAALYLGRFEQVEAVSRDVIAAIGSPRSAVAGKVHASASNSLAFALHGQGRNEEAEQIARDAVAELAGPELARFRGTVRLNLARSLRGQRRFAEALAEVATARTDFAREQNAEPGDASAAATGAAAALLGLGRPAEAEAHALDALELCRTAFGPTHHRRLEAEQQYALAVAAQGRDIEAAGLLAANHEAWLAAFGAGHPGTEAAAAALSAAVPS